MAETANFPATITTQLFDAVDRLSSTLTADITADDTTIPLASVTGFPDAGFTTIDNETIYYGGKSVSSGEGNLTGCTRGYSGTAVSHTSGTQVKYSIVAAKENRLKVEIIATQGKIGISGSTLTTTIEYKIRNLHAVTQDGSTVVPNLNAEYLGGSTAGEFATGSDIDELSTITTTITSSATPTPARASTHTVLEITALAAAAELQNPTGTPVNRDMLWVVITDDGTARALTYDTDYQDKTGDGLPSTTTISKELNMLFVYNSTDSKWDLISQVEEG